MEELEIYWQMNLITYEPHGMNKQSETEKTRAKMNQSNAWDAWRWRKPMWLAIHDGAITLGASLHEDMTKLISVRGRTLQLEHRLLNHL